MNFLIELDTRPAGPHLQSDQTILQPGPTPGGIAFAENFQALFLNGQGDLLASAVKTDLPSAPSFFFAGLTPAEDEPASLAPSAVTLVSQLANPDKTGTIVPDGTEALAFTDTSSSLTTDISDLLITKVAYHAAKEDLAVPDTAGVRIDAAPPVSLPATEQAMASLAEPQDQKPVSIEPGTPPVPQAAEQTSKSPASAQPTIEARADQLSSDTAQSASGVPAPSEQARADANPALPQTGLATVAAPNTAPVLFTPAAPPPPVTQALMIAVPAEIPNIVARAIPESSGERITVQLDPPELGRVSIDFRFDGQTLQHVTITAETPEAVRQLRQMHGELLEALERNGLGEKDMTFQQQTSQERRDQPYSDQMTTPETRPSAQAAASPSALPSAHAQAGLLPGRLDIRL